MLHFKLYYCLEASPSPMAFSTLLAIPTLWCYEKYCTPDVATLSLSGNGSILINIWSGTITEVCPKWARGTSTHQILHVRRYFLGRISRLIGCVYRSQHIAIRCIATDLDGTDWTVLFGTEPKHCGWMMVGRYTRINAVLTTHWPNQCDHDRYATWFRRSG